MKKVLIVSPNWPPLTYPDQHRARLACAHLREFGWEPLVLALDPRQQIGPREPLLEETLPPDLRVWRSGALPRALLAPFGVRNAGLRAHLHLARLGAEIIRSERPAAAFFTTTMFSVFTLGPRWRRRYGLPYVLDYQDPWVSEAPLAGDGWKRRLVDRLARRQEPAVLRGSAHVVSVSPAYPQALRARHPELPPGHFTVLPFGVSASDFRLALRAGQDVFDPRDGHEHWVYAGRGGADLAPAARAFFDALAKARRQDAARIARVRVHLVGTDYAAGAAGGHLSFAPIARECGVADLVDERPARLGYLSSLRCQQDASALIVFGSTDPGYAASKLLPSLLARKPLLVLAQDAGPMAQAVRSLGGGTLVAMRGSAILDEHSAEALRGWFTGSARSLPAVDMEALERHSARAMTKTLADIFDRCVANGAQGVAAHPR